MLRRASSKLHPLHRLSSYSQTAAHGRARRGGLSSGHILATSAVVVTSLVWYSSTNVVHNDASAAQQIVKAREASTIGLASEDGALSTVAWGSNKYNIIAPQKPGVDSVRTPSIAAWLDNVALRDLALHESHAACIDARGDLYQWGDGYFGSSSGTVVDQRDKGPTLTLRGKNIINIQLTESRVFALSASGRVYVLAVDSSKQSLKPSVPLPSTSAWYRPGWLLGKQEHVDFAEVLPQSHLSWGEKFIAISAGSDHLLAITSSGRTFAHPISKLANSHGQLGFRKFDIPAQSSEATYTSLPSRLPVELTPKAILDPYAKASSSGRPVSASSEVLQLYEDQNIRFSDTLFEIPGLKGVNITQVVAAGRTSFAKTESGKVLGWGANESGQIGLGSNITLDTITVPTEIVLWRNVPGRIRSRCLDVFAGNDLTCFAVERTDERDVKTVDLLMCGNGRWGGLGNNQYSNAQGSPVRAKIVSGLLEYSEEEQRLRPVVPHAVSVSPTGHVMLTLETHERSGPGSGGRDLFVWGTNQQYELGNGKRGSLAAPTTLQQADGTRWMLMKAKADVKDLQGNFWKKHVDVEQKAVAGYGNTIVYWKLC